MSEGKEVGGQAQDSGCMGRAVDRAEVRITHNCSIVGLKRQVSERVGCVGSECIVAEVIGCCVAPSVHCSVAFKFLLWFA